MWEFYKISYFRNGNVKVISQMISLYYKFILGSFLFLFVYKFQKPEHFKATTIYFGVYINY